MSRGKAEAAEMMLYFVRSSTTHTAVRLTFYNREALQRRPVN